MGYFYEGFVGGGAGGEDGEEGDICLGYEDHKRASVFWISSLNTDRDFAGYFCIKV